MDIILILNGITGDRIRCTKIWGGVLIIYNGMIIKVTYEKGHEWVQSRLLWPSSKLEPRGPEVAGARV